MKFMYLFARRRVRNLCTALLPTLSKNCSNPPAHHVHKSQTKSRVRACSQTILFSTEVCVCGARRARTIRVPTAVLLAEENSIRVPMEGGVKASLERRAQKIALLRLSAPILSTLGHIIYGSGGPPTRWPARSVAAARRWPTAYKHTGPLGPPPVACLADWLAAAAPSPRRTYERTVIPARVSAGQTHRRHTRHARHLT